MSYIVLILLIIFTILNQSVNSKDSNTFDIIKYVNFRANNTYIISLENNGSSINQIEYELACEIDTSDKKCIWRS